MSVSFPLTTLITLITPYPTSDFTPYNRYNLHNRTPNRLGV